MGAPAICPISSKVSLKLTVPFPLIHSHKALYLLMVSPFWPLIASEKLPDVLAHNLHNLRLPFRFPVT